MVSVIILNVTYKPFMLLEGRYVECRYAECRGVIVCECKTNKRADGTML
jgi:hypothetical protein